MSIESRSDDIVSKNMDEIIEVVESSLSDYNSLNSSPEIDAKNKVDIREDMSLNDYLNLDFNDLSTPLVITSFVKKTKVKFIFYYHNGYRIIDNLDVEADDLGPIIFESNGIFYRPIVDMRLLSSLDKLYEQFTKHEKIIDKDHPIILSYINNKLEYKNIDMFLCDIYRIINRFAYEILPECNFSKIVKITEITFKICSDITDIWFNNAGIYVSTHPCLIYLAIIEVNDVIMRVKCDINILHDFYEMVHHMFTIKKKKVSRNDPIYVYYMKRKLVFSKRLVV